MKIVRFPEQISKSEFLDSYAAKILECLKAGMESSYHQDMQPDGDDLWYKYLNINLDNGVRYRLLSDSGKVIGYIVWHDHDFNVHIYDLIICPEYQGNGIILRKLLMLFADDIRDMEFRDLVAYTNIQNKRMNTLLKKHGFKVQQTKKRGTVYRIEIYKFFNKFKSLRGGK